MAETVAPEYARFIAQQRRAALLPPESARLTEGEISPAVFVDAAKATELLRVAARRASGLIRPSARNEVVWVQGDNELAVGLQEIALRLATGEIHLRLPVRCDQSGAAVVEVLFAVGSPAEPAGLYAATTRVPSGPDAIVAAWGEALVAFAWQCLLGLASGIAAATGKDERGNLLVPVEMVVTAKGITLVPMARHRFFGSSGLKPAKTPPPAPAPAPVRKARPAR
jgi:hypothetical protein